MKIVGSFFLEDSKMNCPEIPFFFSKLMSWHAYMVVVRTLARERDRISFAPRNPEVLKLDIACPPILYERKFIRETIVARRKRLPSHEYELVKAIVLKRQKQVKPEASPQSNSDIAA